MIETKGGLPLEAVAVEPGLVQLRGDFDAGDVATFDAAVRGAGRRADGALVVDLAEVTFFGSTALSSLVRTIDPAGPTVLLHVSAMAKRVLEVTQTAAIFTIEP